MIDLKTFADLAGVELGAFAAKPTTLTEGQTEASNVASTATSSRAVRLFPIQTAVPRGILARAISWCYRAAGPGNG